MTCWARLLALCAIIAAMAANADEPRVIEKSTVLASPVTAALGSPPTFSPSIDRRQQCFGLFGSKNFDRCFDAAERSIDDDEWRLEFERLQRDHKAALAAWAKRPKTVRIGMTAKQVRATQWGDPEHINSTITAHGKREQWVYGAGSYLYFDNGILTAIQQGQ